MKNLCLIFFSFFTTYIGDARAEEWVKFSTRVISDNMILESYIDIKSITKDDNLRRYWVINNVTSRLALPHKSTLIIYELDCRERKVRLLQSEYFSELMGEGVVIDSTREPQAWVYLERRNIHFELSKILCK